MDEIDLNVPARIGLKPSKIVEKSLFYPLGLYCEIGPNKTIVMRVGK